MARETSSDMLRGSTPALVLAALRHGPAHGYAIAKRLNEATDDSLKLRQGTLYPVLHALERDEFVKGEWEHPPGERARKVYAITERGRLELARHVADWSRFAASVNGILGVNLEPG